MKIADDYEAIKRRLAEIKGEQLDRNRNGDTWMPKCKLCMDTGYRRIMVKGHPQGWDRIVCPDCNNPNGLP
jgi:hypothetical protein